ncbi:MAG: segregation and condensation protein A [Bacteroidetes bacterium CG12_big_fil_rev_8_21_14_0_65_60_17]|nr:MAG: segregation and condensation protein A [Bacteroidetes bacterium CG12_big_fil_rev_8_21_14_0_65_60_17]
MYKVQLQQFEGPLDLLLFFIRRDELDVHDIPISRIADEFLTYVQFMEEVDLDGVGDFLYMAALLISIKTRMLLPSTEVDDDGGLIDPRQELVERLLEYIRFKEASDHLTARYEDRLRQFTRGEAAAALAPSVEPEAELVEATVFDLVSALRRVLTTAPDVVDHAVETEAYTIEEQEEFLESALTRNGRTSFISIMKGRSKPFIITTFLAVLEMARRGDLDIFVEERRDDFFMTLLSSDEMDEVHHE